MSASQSPWQSYTPRIEPHHRHWLTDSGSLTLKLKRHCEQFQVIRAFQGSSSLHLSEQAPLQLRLRERIISRNVLLCCDQQPVVFGHTVTALSTLKRHWPFFNSLGQKALGLALFFNPLIERPGKRPHSRCNGIGYRLRVLHGSFQILCCSMVCCFVNASL